MDLIRFAAAALLSVLGVSSVLPQEAPPASKLKLKDEMRMPWTHGDESLLRLWLVAGPFRGELQTDCLSARP